MSLRGSKIGTERTQHKPPIKPLARVRKPEGGMPKAIFREEVSYNWGGGGGAELRGVLAGVGEWEGRGGRAIGGSSKGAGEGNYVPQEEMAAWKCFMSSGKRDRRGHEGTAKKQAEAKGIGVGRKKSGAQKKQLARLDTTGTPHVGRTLQKTIGKSRGVNGAQVQKTSTKKNLVKK